MAVIEVHVIFDIVCATPYYLEYNTAPHSVDKLVLAKTRLAHLTAEQHSGLTQRMERVGRAAGIDFKWGGKIGPSPPSTREAHRLIRLGSTRSAEVRDAIIEGLFDAYHAHEQDVSEREVLTAVAVHAGVDGTEADAWLDSGADADVVDEMARKNKETFSSSGVPAFIVQGTYRLDGAQDPLELLEVFIKAREEQ
ncbi:hypothetical protein AAE478_009827 [Parahypoxylon ruwenzoriense]